MKPCLWTGTSENGAGAAGGAEIFFELVFQDGARAIILDSIVPFDEDFLTRVQFELLLIRSNNECP